MLIADKEAALMREFESAWGQNIVAHPSWAVRIFLTREIKSNQRKEEKVRAAMKKLREATEDLLMSNKRLEAELLLSNEHGPGNPMMGKA